jgi:hypothetical protein
MFVAQRYRKRLERLIDQWTRYRAVVLNRMGAPDLTPEEEKGFLRLKGKVAEDMTALTHWLSPGLGHEVQSHIRGIHQLLGRYPSLFADRPLDDTLRGEFERDWHDHFLFFHRLKGIKPTDEAKAARPAAMRGEAFSAVETVHRASGGTRFITVTLRLFFIAVIAALVIRILPWEILRGGPAAGGLRGFIIASGDRVKDTFTGVRPPSLGGVLDPVVEAYGSEVTIILLGGLFLVAGYFIFVRMK